LHLARVAKRLTVVGREAVAQAFGLAHIDHFATGIAHQVDTWGRGKLFAPGGIEIHFAAGAWLALAEALRRAPLDGAPEVFERLATLLARARQQQREDL